MLMLSPGRLRWWWPGIGEWPDKWEDQYSSRVCPCHWLPVTVSLCWNPSCCQKCTEQLSSLCAWLGDSSCFLQSTAYKMSTKETVTVLRAGSRTTQREAGISGGHKAGQQSCCCCYVSDSAHLSPTFGEQRGSIILRAQKHRQGAGDQGGLCSDHPATEIDDKALASTRNYILATCVEACLGNPAASCLLEVKNY